MSDLDDKDFAIRAPYIQRILELERKLAELQAMDLAIANTMHLWANGDVSADETLKAIDGLVVGHKTYSGELDKLLAEAKGSNEQKPVFWIDPAELPLEREALRVYCTKTKFDGCTLPLFTKP